MQKEGNEFGASTGRPRRCGWLDLPALKYTVMINGVTQLFMMKADVLNIFEEIKICTHYEMSDGRLLNVLPYEIGDGSVKPVYKVMKGWNSSLSGISTFEGMPTELSTYIHFLEEQLEVPINIVSIGPDRTETIIRS